MSMNSPFETELEELVTTYREALARSKYDDASDVLSTTDVSSLIARAAAGIERASGRCSQYSERVGALLKIKCHDWERVAQVIGVAEGLLHDLRHGYTRSIEELLHSDVFADYLEMADHLLSNGYKDAAAVVSGSTLEAHLKQMASKHGVAIEQNGKPKKADLINSDLVKASAYSKLEQKNVTAWLGLRNSAAHGNYSDYESEQVALMNQGIKDFIVRNPA
jgi:hypothetical protein